MKRLKTFITELSSQIIWRNTYGVARTFLALGTLSTLIFNDTNILFPNIVANQTAVFPVGITKFSIFSILQQNLNIAYLISIVILLVVASGWRPRITGLFHWWISFSIMSSSILVDGGDQVTSVLTLLLLPICLTDNRKWQWINQNVKSGVYQEYLSLIAVSTYFVIRLQVACIYFNAAVGKFAVNEWANGTALYYWFNDPIVGLSSWLRPWINPILESSYIIPLITWGVILFELLLFLGLVINKKWWSALLIGGLMFHFGIILIHGLVSFFFAMAAALILYLGPIKAGFNYEMLKKFRLIKNLYNRVDILTNKNKKLGELSS